MKKLFLILLMIAAIAISCKKSILENIYGKYNINAYTVNGVDSLNLYLDTLGPGFHFYYDEVNNVKVCVIGEGLSNKGYTGHVVWTWDLSDKNSTLMVLTCNVANFGIGPIGCLVTSDWEIIRVTKNEIEMKTQYNNKEYLVNLQEY